MKKTVVFITGTNCVGKTTMAWALINLFGGVSGVVDDVTYCADKRYALAGSYYADKRYGGVDRITDGKGSCTSRLAEVVETALKKSDVVFCEGSFMRTFGLNLTNALFKGERQLVVSLYAPQKILYERLLARSNGRNGSGVRNYDLIFKGQRQAMIAAQKYQSIGVKVLQYDTSRITKEEIIKNILSYVNS